MHKARPLLQCDSQGLQHTDRDVSLLCLSHRRLDLNRLNSSNWENMAEREVPNVDFQNDADK